MLAAEVTGNPQDVLGERAGTDELPAPSSRIHGWMVTSYQAEFTQVAPKGPVAIPVACWKPPVKNMVLRGLLWLTRSTVFFHMYHSFMSQTKLLRFI